MYDVQVDFYTNHKSLECVYTQKELNVRERKLLEFLKDYDMNWKPKISKTYMLSNDGFIPK